MKKLLVMVLLAMLASASTALATTYVTNVPSGTNSGVRYGTTIYATAGALPIGTSTFVVSTNVTLIAAADAGGYNVAAKHLSGDIVFVSSSVAPGITEIASSATGGVAKGTAITAIVADPNGANIYTTTP